MDHHGFAGFNGCGREGSLADYRLGRNRIRQNVIVDGRRGHRESAI